MSHFVRDLAREQLDLSGIFEAYDEERGAQPFHTTMMTALLLYAYYFSESNLRELKKRRVRGYIAAGRTKHGNAERSRKKAAPTSALARAMAARVKRGGHRSRYRLRSRSSNR